MGFIYFWSSRSQASVPALPTYWLDFGVKKLLHVGEYAILTFLLVRALRPSRSRYLLAFLIAAAYAATDEFHQRFSAGRGATFRDVVIDSGAALLTAIVLWRWGERLLGLVRRWTRRRAQPSRGG